MDLEHFRGVLVVLICLCTALLGLLAGAKIMLGASKGNMGKAYSFERTPKERKQKPEKPQTGPFRTTGRWLPLSPEAPLVDRMRNLHEATTDPYLRADLEVMFEQHLIPAFDAYREHEKFDHAGAVRRYEQARRLIGERLAAWEGEEADRRAAKQDVHLKHLRNALDREKPQPSALDLGKENDR